MIKVDLITGFLGSGKTTFITEYARFFVEAGKKVAIIVNDHGAINVDRLLLEQQLGDSCHIEMVIGGDKDCARRRLKTKLIAMAMEKYDQVLVEPSGVFDVDDFMDLLYEEPLERWYEMGNILTIVEENVFDQKEDLSDAVKYFLVSQISRAGCVIISKAHEYNEDVILSKINSLLLDCKCNRKVKKVYIWNKGKISSDDFMSLIRSGYSSGDMIKTSGSEEERFDSLFYFHVKTPIKSLPETIKSIFEDEETGNVIRLKGFIRDENEETPDDNQEIKWLEVNATASDIQISPTSAGQELFIVIGEKLNEEKIGSYWEEYRNSVN